MTLRRFLVLHDYGMGALWWWVRARSAREIVETFAEVEVIDDPEDLARFADGELTEVDIDAPTMPEALDELREQRDAQRGRPGFGALAGRDRVWLRQPGEEGVVWAEELGPDGRRLRQVEVQPDGTLVPSRAEDWAFNPPTDLHDPDLVRWEITEDEFEQLWDAA
ncbi:hypothetical protein QLQ12_26480 [Actinoplanes sp. NEAU-A12]|uniref:DUF3071 domain-containing protein n=1 Tax=Actinoplanes sandaracinus TaxID=3045177 RepID=A0ABT6WRA7_9ACTN|nr:hypothetical protein [Actinoplanes sandaracinus]MDI6102170.1 hypothetical protein [Actinoplanes sandaracinus]